MSKKLPKSINLIDTINPPGDAFTIFYEWTFAVGKYLLIFVQILVVAVFAMRLTVDRINNDLTREINNQVDFLLQVGVMENEPKFRTIQSFFKDLDGLSETQAKNSKKIVSVLDTIPRNMDLINFSYSNGRVGATFVAKSLAEVTEFESFLKQSPEYSDVKLNLEKKGAEESVIEFNVSYLVLTGQEIYGQ